MTRDTRQLLMFMLGFEKGEVIRLFREGKITKEMYNKRFSAAHKATNEIMEIPID